MTAETIKTIFDGAGYEVSSFRMSDELTDLEVWRANDVRRRVRFSVGDDIEARREAWGRQGPPHFWNLAHPDLVRVMAIFVASWLRGAEAERLLANSAKSERSDGGCHEH